MWLVNNGAAFPASWVHSESPQGSANVFHQQDEMKLVGRARLKLGDKVKAKVAGFGGFAESRKQSHGLGIATGALSHPIGGSVRVQLGHAPGVIGDDPVRVV